MIWKSYLRVVVLIILFKVKTSFRIKETSFFNDFSKKEGNRKVTMYVNNEGSDVCQKKK